MAKKRFAAKQVITKLRKADVESIIQRAKGKYPDARPGIIL